MKRITPRARRRGFTLIEVLAAIILLAVVFTMLASFSVGTATQLVRMSHDDARQAVTLKVVNRAATLPYDLLPSSAGCRTITVGNLGHNVCITVTTAGQSRTVQAVITPLRAGIYADTIVMERVRAAYNPFNAQ